MERSNDKICLRLSRLVLFLVNLRRPKFFLNILPEVNEIWADRIGTWSRPVDNPNSIEKRCQRS